MATATLNPGTMAGTPMPTTSGSANAVTTSDSTALATAQAPATNALAPWGVGNISETFKNVITQPAVRRMLPLIVMLFVLVVFGLTYNFIPFMTLPLFTTLERLDIRYLEAGADLYAGPATTFRKITLPLSMPGVISGTLLTFIPIAGDYVNASRDFLGSSKTSMIGNMVEADFLQNWNYPSASALSVLLMAVILILVSAYVKKSGTEDLL